MSKASEKTELAQDRTAFAEDRTILANERSFASWLRTGMAAVGIGIAFNGLFGAIEPPWVPKAIASAFLLIALVIFITAERRACAVLERLEQHRVRSVRPLSIRVISIGLVGATLALLAAIWVLDWA